MMEAANGPAAWRGEEQARSKDWLVQLSRAERAELEDAAERVRATGLQLDDVTRDDFPLPTLAPTLAQLREEIGRGRGFVLLRGLPIGDYTVDELGAIFWGIGSHLGTGVSQSAAGDRLGHVYDRGEPPADRYYTVGGALEFHMDPVDVVGLLCIRAAHEGGASRIASALAIHNVMLAECPELLELLYRGFHYGRKAHGLPATERPVPVYAQASRGVESYLLPVTIRQAAEEGHALNAQEEAALAKIGEIAARPEIYLDMDFRPGDMQFLNNRTVFHARTDYVDDPNPDLRRFLLRLWLMMSDWTPRAPGQDFLGKTDRAGGGIRPVTAAG